MGYFSIKRAITKQHKLELAYQDATLNQIAALKAAGKWDDTARLKIIIEQTLLFSRRIY